MARVIGSSSSKFACFARRIFARKQLSFTERFAGDFQSVRAMLTLSSEGNGKIKELPGKKALKVLQDNLAKMPQQKHNLYIGHGQYYEHKTNDRLTVLSLGNEDGVYENHPPQEILNVSVPSIEVEEFIDEVEMLPQCIASSTGELNCLHTGEWTHGFISKPVFSMFSKQGPICYPVDNPMGASLRVNVPNCSGDFQLQDFEKVQIAMLDEPWSEQFLEIKLKNEEVLSLLDFEYDRDTCTLGQLMVETEWMVKAAGHLVLLARTIGNSDAKLLLPRVLTADGNMLIQIRNSLWARDASNLKE